MTAHELPLLRVLVPAQGQPDLEQEELLEDQSPLRGGRKAFSASIGVSLGGKVRLQQRRPSRRPVVRGQQIVGHRVEQHLGQLLQRLRDKRRCMLVVTRAGALVDGHDSAGVQACPGGGASDSGVPAAARSDVDDFVLGSVICRPRVPRNSTLPNRTTCW